jgi:hypothetical protein
MSQGRTDLTVFNTARKSRGTVLHPYRRTPLNRPGRRWRDQLVEPSAIDGVLVELAGGCCRPLLTILEEVER